MKKFMLLVVGVLMMAATASAQNGGGSDNQLIGRAIGAYNSGCPGDYNGAIEGQVEVRGICFVSGFIRRVVLYPKINCQVVDCQTIRYAPVGYVDFDCEDNIINVSCDWN